MENDLKGKLVVESSKCVQATQGDMNELKNVIKRVEEASSPPGSPEVTPNEYITPGGRYFLSPGRVISAPKHVRFIADSPLFATPPVFHLSNHQRPSGYKK